MAKIIKFSLHPLNEALVEAVIANNYQETCALLAQGANPNGFIDRDKLTPLFFAVQNNALKAAFALLAAGANPNYYCEAAETTPLQLAKDHSNEPMRSLLSGSKGKTLP